MNEEELKIEIERVDDIPLLLSEMQKLGISELVDEHYPAHGNWGGLSPGEVLSVWLSYILSAGDPRLSHVEGWVGGIKETLSVLLEKDCRGLDFSDDRLGLLLERLGDDGQWEDFEGALNRRILRVYDMDAQRVRIDSTTVKGYVEVSEEGLFQFGHSKDHRGDLPQVKINQSALDPLGIPLTTTIVRGNQADEPLYLPEIRRVQSSLNKRGLLYIGDSKMSSLGTRGWLAGAGDYYLCPLTAVQCPTTRLHELLEQVWQGKQSLEEIKRNGDKIAEGFCYEEALEIRLEGEPVEWLEKRCVVRSLKHAASSEHALQARLGKAQEAIERLNKRGRGRKLRTEQELRLAVAEIVRRYRVEDLLSINYLTTSREVNKRPYRDRPAQTEVRSETTVEVLVDPLAYQHKVRTLGWKVYVCNDLTLNLTEVVLAYREEYLVEQGFHRYKGKSLGLTPMHLASQTRIKGLIRLLSIGLRILCLLEFSVRKALDEQGEKLAGIYPGNPKRATDKPTAEMMLKAFKNIHLTHLDIDGDKHRHLSPLSPTQQRILALMSFPENIYLRLLPPFYQLASEMSEP